MKKHSGFTLIEVLIAFSIVAFSLVALMQTNSSSLDRLGSIKNKTLANIIVDNLAIEVRLSTPPNIGIKDGEYKMANKTWQYQYKTEQVPIPGINITKTTINLFKNKDDKNNKKPIGSTIIYLTSLRKLPKPVESANE